MSVVHHVIIPSMFRCWCLTAGMFLAACTNAPSTPPTKTTDVIVEIASTDVVSLVLPRTTSVPDTREVILKMWVEPELGLGPDSPGGLELKDQLLRFEEANPGVEVELRIKRATGPGGMLDSIRTAVVAAPGALPDIIAVGSRIIQLAAYEGLIIELGDLVGSETLTEIYDFALESTRLDGRVFGIPFSSDALVAVYSDEAYSSPPETWGDILDIQEPLLFPAADEQALTALQQYLALGGALVGEDQEIALTTDPLTQLLGYYADARRLGVLTAETLDYDAGSQTWAAYRGMGSQIVVTNAHNYILEHTMRSRTRAVPIPTEDGMRLALAECWAYALVDSGPGRQTYALMLVDWLMRPDNLGTWSIEAGYLPPRIGAVESWPTEDIRDFASDILASSIPLPNATTLSVVGPPLKEAIASIMRGQAAPQGAAAAVINIVGDGQE